MKDNKLEKPKPIRKIPNKKITPNKSPRPNIMWFYAIIVVVLLGVATLMSNNTSNPITFQRFSEEMLKTHDVEKVVAYKSGDLVNAEVYIKKSSISKPQFADARKDRGINIAQSDNTAQYFFTAATFDSLTKEIADAEKNTPDD